MMHSNVLDSRSIGLGDAYGQRFMKAGVYRYNVVRPGGGRMVDEYPYEIEVTPGDSGGDMHQETVMVHSRERSLHPDQDHVEIRAGDLVIWAPASSDVPRFEVAGEEQFFGSSMLRNECGYSHAFGLAGVYQWRDANGGDARGVIRVKDPKVDTEASFARWRRRLANAQLVMIHDGKVEPAEVDIEMGQTVYFAVVNGKGISVTDVRLLKAGGHDLGDDDNSYPKRRTRQPTAKPKGKTAAKKTAARRKRS